MKYEMTNPLKGSGGLLILPARLAWASQQKDEEHWVRLAMAGRYELMERSDTLTLAQTDYNYYTVKKVSFRMMTLAIQIY